MFVDYILNGQAHGEFGKHLEGMSFDPGYSRPFFNDKGVPCVTINTGKVLEKDGKRILERKTYPVGELARNGRFSPTWNSTTLRKEEWVYVDKEVLEANKAPLMAWSDLAKSSQVAGINGMEYSTYEYEVMSDGGEAMISMSGLVEGRNMAMEFARSSVPIPIIHVDWYLDLRLLTQERKRGTMAGVPITRARAAAQRIGETVEDLVIGTKVGPSFGTISTGPYPHRDASTVGSKVYGYTNHPMRQVKTDLTTPTGLNPMAIYNDIIEMREMLYDQDFPGPFMLYYSTDWDAYLDLDYGQIGTGGNASFAPSESLRDRIAKIGGLAGMKRLPRLKSATNPLTMIMIQMTPDVAQALNAADIRTIQWETKGGWMVNFRTWAMQIPLLKYDYNDNMGIVHATTT